MKFKDKYCELLTEKKQNLTSLSEESIKLLDSLNTPGGWFTAMAVCEAAIDEGLQDNNILNLREEMFAQGRDLHSGVNLSDEDYADWFAQLVNLNMKLAEAGIAEAWVELSSVYDNARFPHRDYAKAEEYMMKGVDLEDPLALIIYGYHMYCGISFTKTNREKGMEFMLKAREKNCERADRYLLLAEYDSITDTDAYIQKVMDYNSTVKPGRQLWGTLGDLSCEKLKDVKKAVEYYDKGIESCKDPYCQYKKALILINEFVSKSRDDIDEALIMLKEAYEWNIIHAANSLGQFYRYDNNEYNNPDMAIEWYKKAVSYYESFSMFNLAFIYLYDESRTDIKKGLEYIDLAIENGHTYALTEKAYFMLDADEEYRDIPFVKEYLEQACEHGDGYAAYRLGYGYHTALFSEEKDLQKAFEYYTIAAECRYLYAIELLGRYYTEGIIVEVNIEKAIEYYNKAIELGSNLARIKLAEFYEDGCGVEQNCEQAFELVTLAAQKNYADAYAKLGHYYMEGIGCEKNTDTAFEHFTKAAKNGSSEAMYSLGWIYKYAVGRPENPALAIEYFEKAAEDNNLDALVEMGLAYEYEYGGIAFDATKAIEYMVAAAKQGHLFALYKLGEYHYYSSGEENRERGLEYLQMAYSRGSVYAAAALGNHFMYERDETVDAGEAFKYYKYAADEDYVTEGIGLCYLYGIGVESSKPEAFRYFMIAANKNIAAAKFRLGICYKYEMGTVKNLTEAYKWLLEAAEEGDRFAQYETAMALLRGEGVTMDPDKGIEWLRKSADNEYANAQLELGNCYLTGNGVEEDETQAMFWYQKAARNGNENAQRIIGRRDRTRR
jgi:TPR repeat protein